MNLHTFGHAARFVNVLNLAGACHVLNNPHPTCYSLWHSYTCIYVQTQYVQEQYFRLARYLRNTNIVHWDFCPARQHGSPTTLGDPHFHHTHTTEVSFHLVFFGDSLNIQMDTDLTFLASIPLLFVPLPQPTTLELSIVDCHYL